jgi:hypothetical protein
MNAGTPLFMTQRRKLIVGSAIMALAALVVLFGNAVSEWLGAEALWTQLPALVAFVITLYWLSANLKCPACRLKLLWYAFGHAKKANWLDWLLHQTECPKCGHQEKDMRGRSRRRSDES